jgi:hypothetical protein
MNYTGNEIVQLTFSHTEAEYLAAVRFYYLYSKELMARLIAFIVLFLGGLFILNMLLLWPFPSWLVIVMIGVIGFAIFHGVTIDVPRKYFRGNPKYRDEYHLTFSNSGIQFKTESMSASIAWSHYTGVIENKDLYVLIYGNNINSLSIVPKRAFRDRRQELLFRGLLRRHLDSKLKLGEGEGEYVPTSLQPPDWR